MALFKISHFVFSLICLIMRQPSPVFLPAEFPWTEEPGGLRSIGSQRVGHKVTQHTVLSEHFAKADKPSSELKALITVGFPSGSAVKNAPAVQETWVQFLGWDDLLEEGLATHSSIIAWEIPWTEEPGELQSMTQSY